MSVRKFVKDNEWVQVPLFGASILIFAAVLALLILSIRKSSGISEIRSWEASSLCLAEGYPDFKYGWVEGEEIVYCVRLTNGTEDVVPLDSLGQGR